MSLTWDKENATLPASQSTLANLRLTVPANITNIQTFSFNIVILAPIVHKLPQKPPSFLLDITCAHGGVREVQPNNRITVIRQVQQKLNVKIGDLVIDVEDEKGNMVIKKGQLKPV
jgi:hypothetical protein